MKSFLSALRIQSTTLVILLAVYFTSVFNLTFMRKIWTIFTTTSEITVPLLITVPLTLFALFVLVFTPFVSKYITKPVFIFVIITSAMVNYGAYYFGVIFNKDMMTNIFETTGAEAGSYFNTKLALWMIFSGILPALLLGMARIEYAPLKKEILRKLVLMIAAIGMIFAIGAVYYKDYASVARNNPKMQKDIVPTYYLAGAAKYVKKRYFTPIVPYQQIGTDAKRLPPKPGENYLVVFIVGETARSKNYQWNGYARDTNSYTYNIPNVFSFKNAASCGTATAVSLPCMFSMLGRSGYSEDRAGRQDDVIDILTRGGTKSVWIDNNTGCKGVCHGITSYATTAMPELKCSGEDCTDEALLKVLDQQIASFKGKEGVVFLHLLGSHGPAYYKRYPAGFARYKPECLTTDLQKCTDQQIVNSYDNTILFTDYVMSKVIDNVKKYDKTYQTAVFYMSDHGESLGENGLYLHGMPYNIAPETQKHVPFMLWFSDKMMKHKKIDVDCLRKQTETAQVSHDNLSHTLLNLMDIRTSAYTPEKDVLVGCEKE